MPENTDAAVARFNQFLRGELAAIETYNQAIAKVNNGAEELRLDQIHDDHVAAKSAIMNHIYHLGGKPAITSGAWGAFAAAIEGTAKLFGNTAAINILKQGEELGVDEYEGALRDENLGPACRKLINSVLLPPTRKHVAMLDQLLTSG